MAAHCLCVLVAALSGLALLRHAAASQAPPTPYDHDWPNTVAICAIMRLEQTADIREWLQYHRYLGVDQVILYDNNEDNGTQAAELRDFIDDGFLTYNLVSGEAKQLYAYAHCLRGPGKQYSWLASIDIDEYIVVSDPPAAKGRPEASLKAVLKDFRYQPGVMIAWRPFGPSGHVERPPVGGPMKHYTECVLPWTTAARNLHAIADQFLADGMSMAEFQSAHNQILQYGKSIVNTYWAESPSTAHSWHYRGDAIPVTDSFQKIPPVWSSQKRLIDHAQARIHPYNLLQGKRLLVYHYASRSEEDYERKMKRGAGDHKRDADFRKMNLIHFLKLGQHKYKACPPLDYAAGRCCYRNDKPWPPVPEPTSDEIPMNDLGSLADTVFWRNKAIEPGIDSPNIFIEIWRPTALMCTQLDATRSADDLKEWIQHHKYIGVTKVVLYAMTVTGETDTSLVQDRIQALKESFQDFVDVQERTISRDDDAKRILSDDCIENNRRHFAYILYLQPEDYLVVRGGEANERDALLKVLKDPMLRFSPGVAVPGYQFYPSVDNMAQPGMTSLRHYNRCAFNDQIVRTIANTFFITAEAPYQFRGDQLPIPDSGRTFISQHGAQWGVTQQGPPGDIFSIAPPQDLTPDLAQGLAARLAVFSYPKASLKGREAERERSYDDLVQQFGVPEDVCKEGLAAATACCAPGSIWQIDSKRAR